MTINTKFDPGQEVWFMKNNAVGSGTVCRLSADHESKTAIRYWITTNSSGPLAEDKLFPSKAELLASL